MKLFSEACERNKDAILKVIMPLLSSKQNLLEIGSGTGQHAAYFAEKIPSLIWQTSDLVENHASIQAWIDDSTAENLRSPIELDTSAGQWPSQDYDAVFSANTAHIMPWRAVEAMFQGVAKVLHPDGYFLLYGPFNYDGKFTSESNRQFEAWLKGIHPERGIRDFEKVDQLASAVGLRLQQDFEMPANNRLLAWQKGSTK